MAVNGQDSPMNLKRLFLAGLLLVPVNPQLRGAGGDETGAPPPSVASAEEDPADQASLSVAGVSPSVFEHVQSELDRALTAKPLSGRYSPMRGGTLRSEDEFARAEESAQADNDFDRGFQLALQAFLDLPAADNLPRRIRMLALWAMATERTSGKALDEALAAPLLELFDALPRNADGFFPGQLFRAAHFEQSHKGEEAADVYRSLLTDRQVPERYRTIAAGALGRYRERSGDWANAAAAFAEAEGFGGVTPSSAGLLLHAIFLNLHLHRQAEAVRLVGVLAKADSGSIKGAPGEAQIREFIELQRSGTAPAFWARREGWWPQWEDLQKRMDLSAPGPETADPVIESDRTWVAALTRDLASHDNAALFQHLRVEFAAAQWLPDAATNLASIIPVLRRAAPEILPWYRPLVLAMLGDDAHSWGSPDSNGRRLLALAAYYLEERRFPMVEIIVDRLQSQPALGAAIIEQANLLGGMAAIEGKEDRERRIRTLEVELAKPAMATDRARAVLVLMELYDSVGQTNDELQLLKREVENPETRKDAVGWRILSERYARMQQDPNHRAPALPSLTSAPRPPDTDPTFDFVPGACSREPVPERAAAEEAEKPETKAQAEAQFLRSIQTWLARADIPWLGYAEPVDLSDPRLRDLGEVLFSPGNQFTRPELVKLQLLAAQDPRRPLLLRQMDWNHAIRGLCVFAKRQSEVRRLIDGIVDDQELDLGLRVGALWNGIYDSFCENQKDDFERWRQHPIAVNLSADKKEVIAFLARYFQLDRNSAKELVDYLGPAKELVENRRTPGPRTSPIRDIEFRTAMLYTIINVVTERLDELGDAEAMTAVGEWLTSAPQPDFDPAWMETIQKRIRNLVRDLNTWRPIHEAIIPAVVARFPALADGEPAEYADIRASADCSAQSNPAAAFRHRLYMIKHRRFCRSDIYFWRQFLQILNDQDGLDDLQLNIIRQALAATKDDETRSRIVDEFAANADRDAADVRTKLEEILKPYRKSFMTPATYAAIRIIEIDTAERFGQPVGVVTGLDDLRHPEARWYRLTFGLRRAFADVDDHMVKYWLSEMSPQELVSTEYLSLTIPALEKTGRTNEAQRARRIAREALKHAILSSWAETANAGTSQAWNLAEVLNEPGLLPPAWVRDVTRKCGDPWISARLLMTDAWLDQRWADVVKDCDEQLRWAPRRYATFWYKGVALHRLGRKSEAAEALVKFMEFRRDSRQYPQALALLKEINGSRPPSEVTPPPKTGIVWPNTH